MPVVVYPNNLPPCPISAEFDDPVCYVEFDDPVCLSKTFKYGTQFKVYKILTVCCFY
jgi:hypothetical protein